jgi:transcriptional regulator with XRE-family HTH domain
VTTSLHAALARNLKIRRKLLGISQADLAERAGVSVGYIGEIEIARKYPGPEIMVLLAEALETRAYCLLMSEDDVLAAAEGAGRDRAWVIAERLRDRIDRRIDEEVKELFNPSGP